MGYPDGMSDSEATSTAADLEALRALQTDASELERVEELLDRFNVFEAIGFIGREVMHSRFLAFLLDPKRNHGLGDLFLEGFLRKCTESPDGSSLSLGDLQGGDLERTTVRTEVHTGDGRIVILLLNVTGPLRRPNLVLHYHRPLHGLLDKYYGFTKKTYSDWQILGVYLTPFGSLPSREEDRKRYLPLDYGTVCDLLDASLEHPGSDLSPDVRMAMEHYTAMVRRHIVYDPEITRLCRSIYRKHKKALDLIYETSIGSQPVDRTVLTDLVKSNEGLSFIGENKMYLWNHTLNGKPQHSTGYSVSCSTGDPIVSSCFWSQAQATKGFAGSCLKWDTETYRCSTVSKIPTQASTRNCIVAPSWTPIGTRIPAKATVRRRSASSGRSSSMKTYLE
jgi:hypothetical protein